MAKRRRSGAQGSASDKPYVNAVLVVVAFLVIGLVLGPNVGQVYSGTSAVGADTVDLCNTGTLDTRLCEFSLAAGGEQYVRPVTVTNAGGALSDCPVDVDVTHVDDMESDYSDVYFTDSGGNLLPFWLNPRYTSTTAEFVVKMASVPAGDTTIYMKYDGAVTDGSNGATVFMGFEDYEWGSNGDPITGSGGSVTWTQEAGNVDISTDHALSGTRSMELVPNDPRSLASFPCTAGSDYIIWFNAWKPVGTQLFVEHDDATTQIYVIFADDEDLDYYDSGYKDTGFDGQAGEWVTVKIQDIDWTANTYDYYFADSVIDQVVKDDASMRVISQYANKVVFNVAADQAAWIDDVIIRKYVANPPTAVVGDPIDFTETDPGLSVGDTRLYYDGDLSSTLSFSSGSAYIGSTDVSVLMEGELPVIPVDTVQSVRVDHNLTYSLTYVPKIMSVDCTGSFMPGEDMQVDTILADVDGNPVSFQPAQMRVRLFEGDFLRLDETVSSRSFVVPGSILDTGSYQFRLSYYGYEFDGWSNEIFADFEIGSGSTEVVISTSTERAPEGMFGGAAQSISGLLSTAASGWMNVPIISDILRWILDLLGVSL